MYEFHDVAYSNKHCGFSRCVKSVLLYTGIVHLINYEHVELTTYETW